MMKILLSAMVMTLALLTPALADPGRDFGVGKFDVQAQRSGQDRTPRQPSGDSKRAERPPERERRPGGRLSEEERRELRRDIDRAQREIYKGQR